MGNDWTRLTHEAKVLGGPDGLRRHYASAGRGPGRVEGALGVAAVAIAFAGVAKVADMVRQRVRSRAIDEQIAALESAEAPAVAEQAHGGEGDHVQAEDDQG